MNLKSLLTTLCLALLSLISFANTMFYEYPIESLEICVNDGWKATSSCLFETNDGKLKTLQYTCEKQVTKEDAKRKSKQGLSIKISGSNGKIKGEIKYTYTKTW